MVLIFKIPRKPASENVVFKPYDGAALNRSLSLFHLCRLLNILENFSNHYFFFFFFFFFFFCIQAKSVAPDQTAPTGAVCSGSTTFCKNDF